MPRRIENQIVIKESSCWQRRTIIEKLLCALCIFAAIAIVALCLSLYFLNLHSERNHSKLVQSEALRNYRSAKNTEQSPEEIPPQIVRAIYPKETPKEEWRNEEQAKLLCETPGCVKAASNMINYIDESVDPCDNFYEFSCGSYIKNTAIPEDKVTVDSFSDVRDLVQEQLRTIINEPVRADESKPFRLAKNFNFACLNKTIIEERGIKPLADILEAFGGWPVVKGDAWSDILFDWVEVLKKFRIMGLDTYIVFAFSVQTDLKNSTTRVLDIDQTSLELGREYLVKGFDDPAVKAYFNFMVDNAVIFGANKTRAEEELKEALEFEIKLANISLAREDRRNASALYNPYTIKQLQEAYPYLNWLDYINALMPSNVQVNDTEIVINSVPAFFEKLGDVINSTPKRALANYFLWRVVLTTSGTLTTELRQRKLEFYKVVYGLQGEEPRWKECIQFSSENLPISVGALYVRKYFPEESRRAAIDLVDSIRDEFMNVLHDVSWMDESTRQEAVKKAEALTTHIGYPNELADNNKLEEYYNDLEIEPDNLLLNTLRLTKFSTDKIFGKLRKPVNKTDWETHSKPSAVNAFYSSIENSIQFPAAILQDSFFSVDRPRYMNYASIGSVIGHEITHGFDDQGRQFDLNGNLRDWWDPKTQEQFLEKAKCIIEQYGNFTDASTNLSLNGINTQGENIADNGGAKEAYIAYNNWVKRNGPEGTLPGLKYNQQQLFWITLAQSRCTVGRDAYNQNKILTGYHAPNEFRVVGVVNNMPEFAYDFNCPEGTKMNPQKKCKVW